MNNEALKDLFFTGSRHASIIGVNIFTPDVLLTPTENKKTLFTTMSLYFVYDS